MRTEDLTSPPRRRGGLLPVAAVGLTMLAVGGYLSWRLDQQTGVDPARYARFQAAVGAGGS